MMWAFAALEHRTRRRPWHDWLSTREAAVLPAFFPLLDLLATRVEAAASASGLRLTPECVASTIAGHAGRTLHELLARVLVAEYRALRDTDDRLRTTMPVFSRFCADLFRYIPLRALHARYPLLEDRIDRVCSRTLQHLATIFSRLSADLPSLQAMTPGNALLGELEAIEEVGDPHRDGACVTLLAVASANGSTAHFIYKPHPVTADVAFAAFLQVAVEESGIGFRTPWYIQRDEYGWVEHIPQAACGDQAGVERYYLRLGWLLAVIYALNGSDIHAGNVIAHGEHPVIVDLECLLAPSILAPARGGMFERAWVTATGMVPMCRLAGADYRGLDSSAFSGRNGDAHVYREWHLDGAQTTSPVIERQPMRTSGRRNIPSLDGTPVEPLAYGRQFVAGFTAGYRQLLASRQSLVATPAFAAFRNIPVRVVLRNTGEYLKLLYESTHPQLLRDAAATSALWATLPARATDPVCRDRELADLEDGIVPRFCVDAASTGLRDSTGSRIDGALSISGLELLHQQWEHRLSDVDAVDQARLLEQCLGTQQLFSGRSSTRRVGTVVSLPNSAPLELLESIASHVASRAVQTGTSPTWFRTVSTASDACLVVPMDWSFSHGLFGMAFAAHHALQRIDHADLELLASAVIHRIREGDPLHRVATRLPNARAGLLVLPALMNDPRWGIDASHYARYFAIHHCQAQRRMGADTPVRSARDLLLTLAAEAHSSVAIQLSDALADVIARHAIPGGDGFWNGRGIVHLAIARHAIARGSSDAGPAENAWLGDAMAALEAADNTSAPVAEGLGWLRLAVALNDAGAEVGKVVESLVFSLRDRVVPWNMSALHGLTGWVDMLCALSSRGLAPGDECERARALQAGHVRHALDACKTTDTVHWSSVDLAHGWAGVMLRLCEVSAISSAPPLGQL